VFLNDGIPLIWQILVATPTSPTKRQRKEKKRNASLQSNLYIFPINAEVATHLLIFYYFLI
jgi:hypothetical protein